MRKRTRSSEPLGSRWMSDAPCSTAWATIWLTSRMTGASSADSRRSTISAGALLLVLEVGRDDVVQARQARDEACDVLAAGDRGADLLAGQQRDVVDGEDVGGVGHRDEQRAVVEEADRHRLVALGGGDRDEVRRLHVGLEDRQVEVLEAVALGDGARVAVGGQRAGLQQHVLGRLAGAPRLLDRRRRRASRSTSPRSTMTSVRKRAGPPARRGLVMPFGLGWMVFGVDGDRASGNIGLGSGSAHRGAHGLQRRRLARPEGEAQRALAYQDLETVDDAHTPLLGLCESAPFLLPCRPGPPRSRTRRAHRHRVAGP